MFKLKKLKNVVKLHKEPYHESVSCYTTKNGFAYVKKIDHSWNVMGQHFYKVLRAEKCKIYSNKTGRYIRDRKCILSHYETCYLSFNK